MLYPKDPAVRVERLDGRLILSWRRPPGEGRSFLVAAGLFFVVLLPVVFLPTIYPSPDSQRSAGEYVLFFVIACLFTVVPLTYLGLVSLLNSTTVTADTERLDVSAGPVPSWVQRKNFATAGLKQFFAVSELSASSNSSYRLSTVYLLDSGNHVWRVASGLPSSFAAHQICHELEDFYGIEDLPVYGVTTDPSHPGPRP